MHREGGLLGVSYYAMNQWQVAALQPPHLTAICPWEGGSDFYRDFTRHGGILNVFVRQWYPPQVAGVQHGVGEPWATAPGDRRTVAGPETVTDGELQGNRADTPAAVLAHPLDDGYYRERSPVLEQITVPVLSSANWAHHLHTRGNFEGYSRAASTQKWLEVHGLQHWVEFYTDYGVRLQKRFFGHFLKGEDTGWDAQPPVVLQRSPGGRQLRGPRRGRVAAAAYAVDQVPPRHRGRPAGQAARTRSDGARPSTRSATASRSGPRRSSMTWRSPARQPRGSRSHRPPPTPTCS